MTVPGIHEDGSTGHPGIHFLDDLLLYPALPPIRAGYFYPRESQGYGIGATVKRSLAVCSTPQIGTAKLRLTGARRQDRGTSVRPLDAEGINHHRKASL